MTDLPRSVHLLGICGTAMTALAGCLQAQGVRVTGSDEHPYPPMSEHLAALGIACNEGYRPEHIPPDVALVVVGNVIRESNPEAVEMRRRGLPHVSMAEAVQRFAIGPRHTVAVVGTHGKTTTTALAAHALVALGADPGFLIGGIANNFASNFRVGGGAHFVIEGDEYDTAYFDKTPKFFKYGARTLLFTSLEFDHADIYADLDAIRAQFAALLAGLPADGRVIACTDDPNVRALLPRAAAPVTGYGFGPEAHCRLLDWADDGTGASFTTDWEGRRERWRLPLPGRHNALNAAAVIALCRGLGHEAAAIQAALDSFRGVKRRQEVRGEADGVTVMTTSRTTPPPSRSLWRPSSAATRAGACGPCWSRAASPRAAAASRRSSPRPWPARSACCWPAPSARTTRRAWRGWIPTPSRARWAPGGGTRPPAPATRRCCSASRPAPPRGTWC
jgi:UDP-N-acetylmuramate: L-alanyl-gamma-D-glutamyl-meso-diaminopimelate ligase